MGRKEAFLSLGWLGHRGQPLPEQSPCGEPFLNGNGSTPLLSQVMGASTKISDGTIS